jgi:predicted  nucleic acid-binding Zn-ribbon protein
VKREDEKLRELTQEMEQLQSVTDKLRHHVAELDARVTRLEVREELWEEPSAAGDEAVPE